MSEFRKIYYPKSPCCKVEIDKSIFSSEYAQLVGMTTGHSSDDVILTCKACGKKYRVTCTIKYNTRMLKEQK